MINFEDNLEHRQLYAQLKQEVAEGARYWLTDEEISTLIAENERFQRIDSLEEMIASTFRKPEEGEEGRWISSAEALQILQNRFGKATMADYNPEKVGNRLSRRRFDFESDHKHHGNCYLLIEI